MKVLPDPVCPYAKIVELNPFVTSLTHSMLICKSELQLTFYEAVNLALV